MASRTLRGALPRPRLFATLYSSGADFARDASAGKSLYEVEGPATNSRHDSKSIACIIVKQFFHRCGAALAHAITSSPGGNFMGFATDAIHIGQEPEPATGAIVAPIYQTSTYVQEAFGKNKGYDYARTDASQPARPRALRGAASKEATRLTPLLPAWRPSTPCFGCCVPATTPFFLDAVYGGVYRLTTQFLCQFGIEFSFVDMSNRRGGSRGPAPEYAHDLRRDAHQSHHDPHRYRRRLPPSPTSAASPSPWTTPSSAPICSAPSSSARTSWCTP